VVACLCADGGRLPMFWIDHERPRYRVTRASRERVQLSPGVGGMSTAKMLEWAERYKDDFRPDSILVLDRLAAHLNGEVREVLADAGIAVRPLPAKGALLLSPLDNGLFSEFNRHFIESKGRRPVDERWRKWNAACDAYDAVPASHVRTYFRDCGMDSSDNLSAVRERFLVRSGQLLGEDGEELVNTFEKWAVGVLDVPGTNRLRRFTTGRPSQLPDTSLDGSYWLNWGGHHGF
jgi:hypothetical protein